MVSEKYLNKMRCGSGSTVLEYRSQRTALGGRWWLEYRMRYRYDIMSSRCLSRYSTGMNRIGDKDRSLA